MKDFLKYQKLAFVGLSNTAGKNNYYYFAVYFACFISLMSMCRMSTLSSWCIVILSLMWVCTISPYCLMANSKPSLLSLIPVNYKKRTLYFYLCSFIEALIITLIVILLVYAFALISYFTIRQEGDADLNDLFIALSPAAYIVSVGSCFYHIGAVTLITRVKNNKHFWLRFVIYLAVNIALYVMLYFLSSQDAERRLNHSVLENLSDSMTSWIAASVYAAISVIVFTLSVIWAVKLEKPKKF